MDVADDIALYLLLDQDDRLYRLQLAHAGSATAALSGLARCPQALRVSPAQRERAAAWPDGSAAAAQQKQWRLTLNWLQRPGHTLWRDAAGESWPLALSLLEQRPPLLFLAGEETALGLPQVAVVGSRAATRVGLMQAQRLAGELAMAGLAITSGLASGIDGAAHEGALAVSGMTLAVLGCGPDRVYPPRHEGLMQRIRAEGGLLVSEFAPGTLPCAWHFPRRNRVISALSLGVLVVEAGPDSGSIITARAACDMSRDVWAVPGPVQSLQSRGCHQLIRQGQAMLVETAADVLTDVMPRLRQWYGQPAGPCRNGSDRVRPPRAEPGAAALALRDGMDWQVQAIDDLVAAGLGTPGAILAALGELELLGWVVPVPGGYQRLPP